MMHAHVRVASLLPQACKVASRPEKLESMVAHVVAVKDVRLIRDKFTGQPRGFGFMEFHSVQDAARALQLLQVQQHGPFASLSRPAVEPGISYECLLQAGMTEAQCHIIKDWRHAAVGYFLLVSEPDLVLQNARVAGQQSVLKPSYAKQRATAAGPVPAAVEVRPASCEHCVRQHRAQ